MTTTRTTEPTQITRGERVAWTKTLADYGASDWSLEYRFRGAGTGIDVNATADGDDFLCEITAAASAAFGTTGKYRWQAWLTETADANNTFPIAEGTVEVKAGFSTSVQTAVEIRTPAKIMLDTIDAALLAFATSDVMEYEIETPAGRRKVKRSDKATLTSERKYWAGIVTNEIAREGARNGKPLMKSVKVVMYDE